MKWNEQREEGSDNDEKDKTSVSTTSWQPVGETIDPLVLRVHFISKASRLFLVPGNVAKFWFWCVGGINCSQIQFRFPMTPFAHLFANGRTIRRLVEIVGAE